MNVVTRDIGIGEEKKKKKKLKRAKRETKGEQANRLKAKLNKVEAEIFVINSLKFTSKLHFLQITH